MTSKSKALKGYKGRDPISHRKSSRAVQQRRFKKTGTFTYRGKGALKGSGHKAGEEWAERKGIDPDSRISKYSKNSPSFDEGVSKYKQSAKQKALEKISSPYQEFIPIHLRDKVMGRIFRKETP